MDYKQNEKEILKRAKDLQAPNIDFQTQAEIQREFWDRNYASAVQSMQKQNMGYAAVGAKPPRDLRLVSASSEINKMAMLCMVQIVLMIALQFVLMLFYSFIGIRLIDVTGTAFYWMTAVITVLATLMPAVFYALFSRETKISELVEFRKNPVLPVMLGVLASFAICLIANYPAGVIIQLLEKIGYTNPPQVLGEFTPSSLIYAFSIAILAPVFEEFVFRGIIFGKLEKHGTGFAMVVSSLLFGFAHLNLSSIVFAFICGMVFSFLYVRTRNLWVPVAVHFLNNTLSVAMSYINASGAEGAVISGSLFMVFVLLGIIALILILIMYRGFYFPSSNNQQGYYQPYKITKQGTKALSAGETVNSLTHSAGFWVYLGMVVIYFIFTLISAWLI